MRKIILWLEDEFDLSDKDMKLGSVEGISFTLFMASLLAVLKFS